MYQDGQGTAQNFEEAIFWFSLSAVKGDAFAQSSLGFLYGFEIWPREPILAYMWENIAKFNGSTSAGLREAYADQLTPEELDKSVAMAKKCMNSDYQDCGY